MAENGRTWRDSLSFATFEGICFAGVFVAGTYNYLPISHTPYLLVLAWLMLIVRGKRWADVGLTWPDHARSGIVLGLIAGVVLSVNELMVIEPIVRSITHSSPDLSLFKELKGNLQATLLLIALSWVLAAFGEEMVWRGYAMTRVAEVLGGSASAWALSLILVNVVFGIGHDYQSLSGIIVTAIGGIAYGVLYLLAGRNLLVPIMAHGAQNTCDLLFIYHGGLIPGT